MSKDKPNLSATIVRAFKAGDVVFVKTDKALTVERLENLHTYFKRNVPMVRVAILGPGFDLAAQTAGDGEEDLERYRVLRETVRDFLGYIGDAAEGGDFVNPKRELALILAMRNALDGLPR